MVFRFRFGHPVAGLSRSASCISSKTVHLTFPAKQAFFGSVFFSNEKSVHNDCPQSHDTLTDGWRKFVDSEGREAAEVRWQKVWRQRAHGHIHPASHATSTCYTVASSAFKLSHYHQLLSHFNINQQGISAIILQLRILQCAFASRCVHTGKTAAEQHTTRARAAHLRDSKRLQFPSAMRLVLLFVLSLSCAAAVRANDADEAEWGIFAALRTAQSAGAAVNQCSCCEDVQDLRRRIAALEQDILRLSEKNMNPPMELQCPSVPDLAAASAAAVSAEPTLARLQASYCSEWVRTRQLEYTVAPSLCHLTPAHLSIRPLKRAMAPALIRSRQAPRTRCCCWASFSVETVLQMPQVRTVHTAKMLLSLAVSPAFVTVTSAVESLLASAALQPNNAQAHLLLSRIYRGQRKFHCALHHVAATLNIQGDSVDVLSAFAFLLQHNVYPAAPQVSSSTSKSDVQQRLCRALNSAAAVHNVVLPPSICLLAPPALPTQDTSYSTQWSTFFRAHMPGHMLSNSFLPGHPSLFCHTSQSSINRSFILLFHVGFFIAWCN
jgi:hypothetical protein